MKRLRKNSGFTLVECVVAMAVLAIMTLGLMMILNASVKQRNQNMMLEQNIDKQVEQVVQGDSTTAVDIGDDVIELGGYKVPGIQMVYLEDDDTDLQIGALYYEADPNLLNPDPDSNPDPDNSNKSHSEKWNVYGGLDIDHIEVGQAADATLNADGTYTLGWDISFSYSGDNSNHEKSVKVVLPTYANILYTPTVKSGTCDAHKIGNHIIRIEPMSAGYYKVNVEFTVPGSQYEDYVGNQGKFISDHFGKTQPDMFT